MNILGHYYLSFEIIISVSFFCEIVFSFLPTASSVCDLIAGSHTFCYRDRKSSNKPPGGLFASGNFYMGTNSRGGLIRGVGLFEGGG